MRTLNRIGMVCTVIAIGALAACTSENREKQLTDRQDAAKEAVESPAVVEAAQSLAAEGDRTIPPGVYHFKAKVGRKLRMPHGKRKYIQGVFSIDGVPCVFSGYNQRWAFRLVVDEVDEPLWFLQPGKEVRFMSENTLGLTGGLLGLSGREQRDFTLAVYEGSDGQLRFDLTTPVEDMGVPEVSEDDGPKATMPPNDAEHHVEPGVYHFKAKVVDVSVAAYLMNKSYSGILTIDERHHVYSGFDQRWAVKLRVIKIDKPVWFMRPGKIIRFMVHSPSMLFGESQYGVTGRVREFTFNVSLDPDGRPRFGILHTPGGTGRHGMPADAAERSNEPQTE